MRLKSFIATSAMLPFLLLCSIDANSSTDSGSGSNESVTDDTICFAAVSDQHYGYEWRPEPTGDMVTVNDWMTHPDLPEFDFVVASFGDWISDNRGWGSWSDVEYCWQRITENNANHQVLPYFFVYGNHDITNYERMPPLQNPVLKERLARQISGLNENNYAFMYNNVLFICVAQTNVLYHLSAFQRSWIEYLVDRYPDNMTVLWAHQAIFETTGAGDPRSTTWTSEDYRYHNDVAWWQDLFENNPQIKLYIHGHNERGVDTVVHNLHEESWDDHCTFVLVPSNGRLYGQDSWSYLFTITGDALKVELWDSAAHTRVINTTAGLPYIRSGLDNSTSARGMEWISIPKRVLDGQNWRWWNRILARSYSLELIGSNLTEQIDNPDLEGCHESDEVGGTTFEGYWYAVQGDQVALNLDTGEEDGFIRVPGGPTLGLAASPSRSRGWVEGKVPYNTALAIPGKRYKFSARLRTEGGLGLVRFRISIPRLLDLTDYIWNDVAIGSPISVGPLEASFTQYFTVPPDPSAWFIQPKIQFLDPSINYIWESWSLQMESQGNRSENFSVSVNQEFVQAPDVLKNHEFAVFDLGSLTMDNALDFSCSIGGSRVGIVRLIYEAPQFWSDDVSIGVQKQDQTQVRLLDHSPYNDRTTIMCFEDASAGFIEGDFQVESIRGKRTFLNSLSDGSIDGSYQVHWEPENRPPATPARPKGPIIVQSSLEYEYRTHATDPDGDAVDLLWLWGDYSLDEWRGPYSGGHIANAFHSWSTEGDYVIRVKARDTERLESDWSEPLWISVYDVGGTQEEEEQHGE